MEATHHKEHKIDKNTEKSVLSSLVSRLHTHKILLLMDSDFNRYLPGQINCFGNSLSNNSLVR